MRKYWTDLRLAPLERARLGARGTIFASRTVNRLFMQVEAQGRAIVLEPQLDEGRQILVRMRIAGALAELEDAIRRELGADRILQREPGVTHLVSPLSACPDQGQDTHQPGVLIHPEFNEPAVT